MEKTKSEAGLWAFKLLPGRLLRRCEESSINLDKIKAQFLKGIQRGSPVARKKRVKKDSKMIRKVTGIRKRLEKMQAKETFPKNVT